MKFLKKHHTTAANEWMRLMEKREIEKNNFHATGQLKEAKLFATAAMTEVVLPNPISENIIEPIVIFSRELIESVNPNLAI